MYCPSCGHLNPDENRFCGKCGVRMTGVMPIRPLPQVNPFLPFPARDAESDSTPQSERRTAAIVFVLAIGLILFALLVGTCLPPAGIG